MGAALLGFLQALPKLVSVLDSLGKEISNLRDYKTDGYVQKIEQDLNETIARIKNETDRNELLKLAARLNAARRGEL